MLIDQSAVSIMFLQKAKMWHTVCHILYERKMYEIYFLFREINYDALMFRNDSALSSIISNRYKGNFYMNLKTSVSEPPYTGGAISPKVFWQENSAILEHSAIFGTFGDMGTKSCTIELNDLNQENA